MPRYKPLTPAQKKQILDLYRRLSNGHEVARRLGISKSVVYKVIGGIWERPRWTDNEKAKLTEEYLKGKLPAEIAKKIGRSPTAVKVAMCRHRKKVRNDPNIQRAAFLLETAFAAGLTPGRAIQRIRTCDAYARIKMESDVL